LTQSRTLRVTILLSESEYGELRLRAGDVPLGRYCRNLIVGVERKPEAMAPKAAKQKSRFSNLPVMGE